MKMFFTGLLGAFIFLLSACSGSGSGSENESIAYVDEFSGVNQRKPIAELSNASIDNLLQPHLEFSFSQFSEQSSSLENIINAPFDLQQLLAQLSVGAEGTTLSAFMEASYFNFLEDASYDDISLWEQQISGLASIDRKNMLWGQVGYRFNRNYLNAQAEYWGTQMMALDFLEDPYQSASLVTEKFNMDWLLPEIGSRSRLVISQLSSLSTDWSDSISTQAVVGRFVKNNQPRLINMVRFDGNMNTAATNDYSAVELPLSDAQLSMIVITPTAGAFKSVRTALDGTLWNDLLASLSPASASIYLPEFTLEREFSSVNISGLSVALTEGATLNAVDFSAPTSEPGLNVNDASLAPANPDLAANFASVNNAGFLFLEPPLQYISLNMNAAGLSAKTITTAVHTATRYEPLSLFVDANANFDMINITVPSIPCYYLPKLQPFIFAIYAKASGSLLYLGQVVEFDESIVNEEWAVGSFDTCSY